MILSHLSKQQIIYYPLQKVTEAEAIYSKLSGPGVLITCRKAVKLTLIAPLIPSEAGAAVELRIRVEELRVREDEDAGRRDKCVLLQTV